MNDNGKIVCFTHYDLDGLACALMVRWMFKGSEVEIVPTSTTGMRQEFLKWMLNNQIEDYSKVFVTDLDTSEIKDLVDKPNVFIIDHHKSHEDAKDYKHATTIIQDFSSACLLMYRKVFNKLGIELTDEQKMLISFCNDFDSYVNEFPESKMMNTVFWNTQKAFDVFLLQYENGYVPLNQFQLNLYNITQEDIQKTIKNTVFYTGIYEDRCLIAAEVSKHISDVSDYIFEKHNPDFALLINTKTRHVSVRSNNDFQANTFAHQYLKGGGHEYAAGGVITENFCELTKTFVPITE